MSLQRIAIIGCSIAGLLVAHDLIAQGFKVTIFDRTLHSTQGGAGLMLNPLLSKEIKGLPCHPYYYRVVLGNSGQELWRQPLKKESVLWGDLYQVLQNRIPLPSLYSNKDVLSVHCKNDQGFVVFSDGASERFDVIIGADGGESTVRQYIDSNLKKQYCGYIAVRGLLSIDHLSSESQPILARLQLGEFLNFWRENTHITCYLLPSDPPVINWMWYVNKTFMDVQALLLDKNHHAHHWSLPQGLMPEKTRSLLLEEAHSLGFSNDILSIMNTTPNHFIQAISSGISKRFYKDNVVIIGDAAHLAVPHIGGSVNLAYYDAITLTHVLGASNDSNLRAHLSQWSGLRRDEAIGDLSIAMRLGQALQFGNNNWDEWTQKQFDVWWKKLTGPRRLYFEI